MGLTANGIPNGFSGQLKGVAQAAFAKGMQSTIQNAAAFGQITSVPQGYNAPMKAILPTIKVGGNISAKATLSTFFSADVKAVGNLSAEVLLETDMIANANVAINGYATMLLETDMTANITAIGNMSASMDLIARPSAFDIANEIWNARPADFGNPNTMGKKLSDAEAAAKLAAALSA